MAQAATSEVFELVPESTVQEDGAGKTFEIKADGPRTLLLHLDIFKVIDQESLDVSIWGSADGQDWGAMPLLKLPQRFYPGNTRAVLDLTQRPEVKHIQARWALNRWGRGKPNPMFLFRVAAKPVG